MPVGPVTTSGRSLRFGPASSNPLTEAEMTDTIILDASPLLTVEDVAARYQTSTDTIYRWMRGRNHFPRPFPLPSRGVRWKAEQLAAWEAREAAAANGETATA